MNALQTYDSIKMFHIDRQPKTFLSGLSFQVQNIYNRKKSIALIVA